MGIGIIDVGLNGIIQFQQSNDAVECFIQDIREDYAEIMVFASDALFRVREDVNLRIFLPAERSPIKCKGRIVWRSDEMELAGDYRGYYARISITYISRLHKRLLELFIAQKKAFISSGSGLDPALVAG
jgi:hypothetical protein